MTPEDRLRSAINARTSSVEPSPDALSRIEEKLMDAQRDNNRKRALIGLGSAVAVVVLVLVAVLATRGDDDDGLDVAGTTTTSAESTTTEATTTTTEAPPSTFAPTVDPAVPVWPDATTSQRFDSPDAAARSFAVDYLGFIDPVMGAFQAGDARSGEVPVQPTPEGPVTTVLVRQLGDDTWFILGADTADITLDAPAQGDQIACPVHLTGTALAFEGHVDVAIRADGVDEPIGTGFVTGGGGPAAPFDDEVTCDLAQLGGDAHYGAIVLSTASGEDGRIWTAEVIRVRLK